MLLTKLKVVSWAVGVVFLAGVGAVGFSYQQAAAQPAPRPGPVYGVAQGRNVAPGPKVGRPAADDLESLRLEIEALRRELRATKETVRELQAEVRGKKEVGARLDRDTKELRRLDSLKLEGDKRRRLDSLKLEGDKRERLDALKLEAEQLHRLDAVRREKAAAKASLGEKAAADPLAELEDAVKRLRKNPKDKQAAEALDRALRRLKERKVPDGGSVFKGGLKKG